MYTIGALGSGALLALAIFLNGELATHTSAIWSSMIAHLVGTLGSLLLWQALTYRKGARLYSPQAPKWVYFAGALGALIVVLSNVTVNSNLGLAGTLTLMILGQSVFAIVFDVKGWLGLKQRRLQAQDIAQVGLILTGAFLVIYN